MKFFRAHCACSVMLAAVLVMFTLGGGCVGKKEPFRIAIVTWVGYGPFYIAQDKGYYKEEGLDVDIVKIEDEGARKSAFTSGNVQGAINTIDALASGAPQGLPGLVIYKIDDSFGGDGIVARKSIKTIQDLKGKTVAYPRGLPSHFFLLYLLRKAGLSSQDIISKTMEAGDAGAAFVAQKVDAAVTWEPWLTQAAKTEHGHILMTTREAPGLIVDVFMISPKTKKERAKDVEKFVRTWFKAIEFIKQHPSEAYEIMAKHLDIPKSDFEGMVQGIKYSDYQENLRYFGLAPSAKNEFSEVFNAAEEIWKSEGVINKTVDAKDVQETSFLLKIKQ